MANPVQGQQVYSQTAVVAGAFRDIDEDGIYDMPSPSTNLLVRYFPDVASIPEQDRSILEFDVSSIPDNAQIVSAEFSFEMGSFSSSPEELEIVGYGGNGVASTDDAEFPGTSLLVFLNTSLDRQFLDLSPGFIEAHLQRDFIGFRFQSSGGNVNTVVWNIENAGGSTVPQLVIEYETVPGKSFTVTNDFEESFRDNEDDGIYDEPSPSNNLLVRYFPLFPSILEQDRTVMEFDVSSIPDGAQINSAEFTFRLSSLISNSSNIDIIGYAGDGAMTTTDAEVAGQFLATFEPTDLGFLTFAIDTDVVADNLASNFVGFRFQSAGGDVLNSSIGQGSGTLSVTYSFPSDIVEVSPTQVTTTAGNYSSGNANSLAEDDSNAYSIFRSPQSVASRTELVVSATSPNPNPTMFDVTLVGNVFARSRVTQTVALFDFNTNSFETVSSSTASRFTDSTVTASGTGDLSRFVGPADEIRARIRFNGSSVRSIFGSNTDQFFWTLQ